MTIQSAVAKDGNYNDSAYRAFLAQFKIDFTLQLGSEQLFTTDATGLFDEYLDSFEDPAERQYHNCSACRHFINHYGGLVTIDPLGKTQPAMSAMTRSPTHSGDGFRDMFKVIKSAKVTGVFFSDTRVLGTPLTCTPADTTWRHLSVDLPRHVINKRVLKSAAQVMAEKREDFININRALSEFSLHTVEKAVTLLKSETLYRSEKVLGAAEWLRDAHLARNAAINRANVTWRAIASAPAGFCHPRSSMIGTLLQDIEDGLPMVEVARRFAEKMHPLQYQRPQAAPTEGNIKQAEKIVADLGAAGSLARRFARLDEVQALWTPKTRAEAAQDGVFGHLKPKGVKAKTLEVPHITMTWVKFRDTILPDAETIEYYTGKTQDVFGALVTAVNPEAPPILQWDLPEQRNPVSWYVWHGGAPPEQYGLKRLHRYVVSAITLKPSAWHSEKLNHHGDSVIFLIKDAKESRVAGAALFPEILKSEFHGIRSVIEAYSRSATIEGINEPHACGIFLQKGLTWNAGFRVTRPGSVQDICLDRWD